MLISSLAQGKSTAIQCFDSTGLPLVTVGKCSVEASKVLSSIYRHAQLVTDAEGERPPVVVLEREKSRILMAQSGGCITAVYSNNSL
ncbi:unnamed protein product [Rodentolepis nana]|uniref:Late endosomal/lysosomal adaptor and MAPK and MTOR activator 5 n=1 Tax=Rodentolepis nana TaxID=102285 RepID=A0A0R3T7J2_RODNA|nr:unnamed protein product [Rodentolepis nana]